MIHLPDSFSYIRGRETLATLPEIEDEFDFEPHDTIPAPPWLEDDLSPSHKTT